MNRERALVRYLLASEEVTVIHADPVTHLSPLRERDRGDDLLTDLLLHTHPTMEAQLS